jgi:type I restriction enzyme S subunit
VKETDRPDLMLLSVYRDHGVIPKESRDDNFNKASIDLTTYQVVRPGRVVANKMKTWQGSIAVSAFEGIVSPAYMVFDADPTIHGRFLHYLLRSRPYVAEYGRLSYGVRPAQWDLRWDDLRDVRLLIPPVDAQGLIAEFLDRETHLIDSLVEAKKKLIDLLAEKQAALITQETWDDRWPTTQLKRHVDLLPGYAFSSDDYLTDGEGVRLLRGINVGVGRISWETTVSWPADQIDSLGLFELKEGDLVIGLDRPWISEGKASALPG